MCTKNPLFVDMFLIVVSKSWKQHCCPDTVCASTVVYSYNGVLQSNENE